jgi:hypothetical protein
MAGAAARSSATRAAMSEQIICSYAHPVRLLNGLFIERDEISLEHGRSLVE